MLKAVLNLHHKVIHIHDLPMKNDETRNTLGLARILHAHIQYFTVVFAVILREPVRSWSRWY